MKCGLVAFPENDCVTKWQYDGLMREITQRSKFVVTANEITTV
jgi:hypothetical protein